MITKEKTKDMVATTEKTENYIGHLFWFSIGQQMNNVADLKQKLINAGLSESWMPNRIRAVDAFRRATREIQTKKPTANPKIFENYLVREVYSDQEMIQRNIVVETVDQNDKKLGYQTQSGVIRLDKKNATISFETSSVEIKELCREAEQKFYLYRDHYSAQHMRVMVTRILNSLAPTAMREKGVIYFVPDKMTAGLTNLVTFIGMLDNSEGFKIPVVDSNDNRFMVSKKLKDHMESLLAQCRSAEELRKDEIKTLVEETNNAIKNYRNYKELTTTESETFEEKIMLLRSEVMKLIQE